MKHTIPYYKEINDFLQSIPSDYRTSNPHFYCLRLKENEIAINNYKAPFRKDFYFIGLITNAGKTKITYDNTNVTKLNSFLVFQSPGLLYSFLRDNSASGYLIYFKKECLSFFKPDFEKEFPFFNILHTNFFKLNEVKFQGFAPHFEDVFSAYENTTDNQHKVAAIKFLALLYQLKEFTNAFKQWEEGFTTPQQILLQKFVQLVNNFYIEKRTIEDYAALLNVTANHLSQSVKSASDKNALSFINDRLLSEAKSIIQFTDFDIAEIAYQLNFSDPANFGKFFKKHTDQTPLEFRKQSTKK
ncbi:MAG: AraC family transcriptional regulator [Chitinophagaceae bacterium]|nr:AraC family transcriptional regulator [Chitinophagaceae bacterium]